MKLEKVIKFLEKESWELAKSNGKFVFYMPPTKLGFDPNYTLPIPILSDARDFQKRLNDSILVLSEIYETTPEKLFYEVSNYLDTLKRDALFFKLNSDEVLFRHTLEIEHVWQFLRNLSSSYSNYVKVKFNQRFGEIYNDNPIKISKAVNKLLEFSRLRLVDLEFQSFSFGVSVDTQMGNEVIDKDIRGFRKEIIPDYKREVIEVDFTSNKDVDSLLQKFSEEERKAIFTPLIKSINKDEYSVSLTNSKFVPRKKYSKIPQSTVKTIIPTQVLEKEESKVEMMQIIVPIDKTKQRITLNTKEIENDLFSQSIDEYKTSINVIELEDSKIELRKKIEFTIKQEKETGEFLVIFEPLNFEIRIKDFSKIREGFFQALIQNLNYYNHLIKSGKTLTKESEIKTVDFFNSILPS